MASQTVIWTALPNGIRDDRLQLSVFVRPRLSNGPELGEFRDWVDWPAMDVAFFVTIEGTEIEARYEGPERRSDLWSKLFPTDTPVKSPDTQGAKALTTTVPKVRSAPIGKLREFVKERYQLTGAFYSTRPPTLDDYYGPQLGRRSDGGFPAPNFGEVALSPEEKAAIRRLIRRELDRHGFFQGGALVDDNGTTYSEAKVNFLLLEQFHKRDYCNNHDEERGKRRPGPRVVEEPAEQLDFHSVVGHLGPYPEVLRLLGLVRDISIPLPTPLPGSPVGVQVRAEWAHTGEPDEPNEYPVTMCEIGADRFMAAAGAESMIVDGLLQLDDPTFQLVEVDADAVGSKLLTFGHSLNHTSSYPADFDQPMPPPSMESTGLALHRADRAQVLHKALVKAAGLQAKLHAKALATTTLHAEDITRGYRLDVWDDETASWHSLCLRSGNYAFDDTTITIDDEGIIESAHTEQADDEDTIYLHESIARWIGYSLVAPRPGLGTAGDYDSELVGPDTEPGERFKLKTSFMAARGTLPKLRYGRTYRLRARVVDLAGNSRSLEDFANDDFDAATQPVTYHRFEPVAAPNVLLRAPRTEGESPELMVIRSNYNKPASADSQRHIAPNKTAELTAEQHGMFDVPANILNPSGMSRLAYGLIAERDPATLADLGELDPGGSDVRYYDTDQLQVPYLPDVLARGAAFDGLPGTSDMVTVDFGYSLLHQWPDARPFRLRVIEGTGAPQWNALSRVLTVKLPKGRVTQVRYSCRINAEDLDVLGMWDWLRQFLDANEFGDIEEFKSLATQGALWLLTPQRTLTLVHAVRQPIAAPDFGKPVAVRQIGETVARIIDKVTVDRRSSSKLDLLATWQESVDVVAQPAPQTVDASDHAFRVEVDSREEASDLIPLDGLHEFHDTKHRNVSYELVATTRFAEYFVERKQVMLVNGLDTPISAAGIVPGSDVLTSTAQPKVTYARGVDYMIDYAAGTVAATDAFPGGAVEVAFVAPPVTRSSTESKPAAVVNIPSSARPIAADIAYLVPTFGWETGTSGSTITSTRLGHGLRVFFRRPWYSSGDGEQIGVVLFPEDAPTDPNNLDRLGRHVTTWGLDPAFATQAPPSTLPRVPLVTDFPRAVRPKTRIKLAESDNDATLVDQMVAVAPHDVTYDAQRQLWFADITLSPTPAYTPFIRLALARYQPDSITGVELSPVTLAQFAQLSPDRTLTITGAAAATTVTVTLAGGMTYAPMDDHARPSEVEVVIQTANPALSGDLAWTTVGPPTALPTGAETGSWSGAVSLPGPRGSQPFRLVVKEFEVPSQGDERRLVYADAVQL